jgi:hypothetical protein
MHEEVKDQLRDHEKRIVDLEKRDAEFTVMMKYLCEKVDALVSWLKAVFMAVLATGGGFIIWYIQQLAR